MSIGEIASRNSDESARLQSIGFERVEVLGFLKRHGIPFAIEGLAGNSLPVVPLLFAPDVMTEAEAGPARAQSQAESSSQAHREGAERLLTTDAMAAAFGDDERCVYKTGRTHGAWKDYLQKSLPTWAKAPHIRVQKGRQSRNGTALWDPFEFAQVYVAKQNSKACLAGFSERFRKVEPLSSWKAAWTLWAADQKDLLK